MASPAFLDPGLVRELLEGADDLILPEAKKVDEYFANLTCPACGDDVRPVLDTDKPFRDGAFTPNYLGECIQCGCTFAPYTGVIVRRGSTATDPDFVA